MRNTPIHEALSDHYRTLEQAEAAYQHVLDEGMERFYDRTSPWQFDAARVQLAVQQEYARLAPLALDAFNEVTDKAGWPHDR